MLPCSVCDREFDWSGRGRRPSVCGQRCRKRRSRSALPLALTGERRWSARAGKRPMQLSGAGASSTNPATWVRYEDVKHVPHGVMLGAGLACWDLDDVVVDGHLIDEARKVLAAVDPLWVEWSMSGRGLHVFVRGDDSPARISKHVSYYSWGRFIAVTGDRYFGSLGAAR